MYRKRNRNRNRGRKAPVKSLKQRLENFEKQVQYQTKIAAWKRSQSKLCSGCPKKITCDLFPRIGDCKSPRDVVLDSYPVGVRMMIKFALDEIEGKF